MQYILSLDQGTTSSRAIIFDHNANVKAIEQKEIKQIYPKPGWVEHDPKNIWETQLIVAREVLNTAKIKPQHIASIGITNQRETTLLWNKSTGTPIYNAIVWQDRRTASYCEKLKKEGHEALVSKNTGLLLDPYFSGTKIHWLLENVPNAKTLADRGELLFGTIDTWIIWNLTEGKHHITDITNASRTLLYNIHTHQWDDDLLKILNIPKSILPTVVGSSEVYAHTSEKMFSHPIPIAGIAGDQQAALFGQMCTQVGMAKNTYGTGCFLLLNTGKTPILSKNKLLTTIAWKLGDQVEYALEGSVFIAGAAIQWLKDGLHILSNFDELDAQATKFSDTGGVFFIPAFAGLGAPYWDPNARGTIMGITGGTKHQHIIRATLEGIAHQVTDLLTAMQRDASIDLKELRVDGGVAVSDFLMQTQSDYISKPVIRSAIKESTALGAAYLAGLAVGFWHDVGELQKLWKSYTTFKPIQNEMTIKPLRQSWRQAIQCTRCFCNKEEL